jgi:nucleotide sugar dehydrogenase
VGLPLAQEAVRSGLSVVGLDVNEDIVGRLNEGKSHVDDIDASDIRVMLTSGFRATSEPREIANADVVVICVPTPLSIEREPDLTAVRNATSMVGDHLRRGMLVVLESTTYPGTTDEVIRPLLETDDLKAGTDFNLAFSPERIDPGNAYFGMRNTPKVVGGVTPDCTQRAADFYGSFIDSVVPARGAREAEMAKLLENTYRHINIALVNEMAMFCHELGIDLWDVIRCASTKPFGFQAFYPGPGVGGHCIPIDPNYLGYQIRSKLGYPFRFVELAEDINAAMPAYVITRLQSLLNAQGKTLKDASVLLLGVTYKPNISDQRGSPAMPLARLLRDAGARVLFHDPYVDTWVVDGQPVTSASDLDSDLSTADISVLLQNHGVYDLDHIARAAQCLFDTRGAVQKPGVNRL